MTIMYTSFMMKTLNPSIKEIDQYYLPGMQLVVLSAADEILVFV